MRWTVRTVAVLTLLGIAAGCGFVNDEERAEEPTAPRTVEETTVVETTVYRNVMEEAVEEEDEEEADAVIGEKLSLGGVNFQIFDYRTEDTIYYVSGPGEPFESKQSSGGEYVAVDFFALNSSDGSVRMYPDEATLAGSDGESYDLDTSIEPPTEDSGGLRVEPDEFLTSTLFFDVPEGVSPETLTLTFGGDESTVDLTNRDAGELEPLSYMAIYTLWFDQRAYADIYGLFDPSSTAGVSEDVWVSYFDNLWGEWYLSLENVEFDTVNSTDTQSFALMDRNFYETSGAVTQSPVEQELIRYTDEWKLVMREDQVTDILGVEPEVPEYSVPEETSPPEEQYDPPDPDPDPDPNRPDRRPRDPGQNNSPNYPSDGYVPGSPDKDCSDFPNGVMVSPGDPYDLDRDDDGIACEPPS